MQSSYQEPPMASAVEEEPVRSFKGIAYKRLGEFWKKVSETFFDEEEDMEIQKQILEEGDRMLASEEELVRQEEEAERNERRDARLFVESMHDEETIKLALQAEQERSKYAFEKLNFNRQLRHEERESIRNQMAKHREQRYKVRLLRIASVTLIGASLIVAVRGVFSSHSKNHGMGTRKKAIAFKKNGR